MPKQQHPITPPPELLKQWENDWFDKREHPWTLLIQAFQAGADQELEECVEWFREQGYDISVHKDLYTARRPKPSSLAEEAYIAFVQICKGNSDDAGTYDADEALVRRALEKLQQLEDQQ